MTILSWRRPRSIKPARSMLCGSVRNRWPLDAEHFGEQVLADQEGGIVGLVALRVIAKQGDSPHARGPFFFVKGAEAGEPKRNAFGFSSTSDRSRHSRDRRARFAAMMVGNSETPHDAGGVTRVTRWRLLKLQQRRRLQLHHPTARRASRWGFCAPVHPKSLISRSHFPRPPLSKCVTNHHHACLSTFRAWRQ